MIKEISEKYSIQEIIDGLIHYNAGETTLDYVSTFLTPNESNQLIELLEKVSKEYWNDIECTSCTHSDMCKECKGL